MIVPFLAPSDTRHKDAIQNVSPMTQELHLKLRQARRTHKLVQVAGVARQAWKSALSSRRWALQHWSVHSSSATRSVLKNLRGVLLAHPNPSLPVSIILITNVNLRSHRWSRQSDLMRSTAYKRLIPNQCLDSTIGVTESSSPPFF